MNKTDEEYINNSIQMLIDAKDELDFIHDDEVDQAIGHIWDAIETLEKVLDKGENDD